MQLKRALKTDCNALSTKRELPTLNFSFCQVLVLLNTSPIEIFLFCFGTTTTFIMSKFLIIKKIALKNNTTQHYNLYY